MNKRQAQKRLSLAVAKLEALSDPKDLQELLDASMVAAREVPSTNALKRALNPERAALKDVNAKLSNKKDDVSLLLRQAQALLELQRPKAALVAIKKCGVVGVTWKHQKKRQRLLFSIHLQLEEAEKAKAAFQEWIALDAQKKASPKDFKKFPFVEYTNYARILKGKSRDEAFGQARAGTLKLISVTKDRHTLSNAWNFLSYICLALGDRQAALDALKQAVAIDDTLRFSARGDVDFRPLWKTQEFIRICGAPGGSKL